MSKKQLRSGLRFSVEQAALHSALALVCESIERRNTIPILSNVRIVAEGKSVTLFGTDLDNEIAITVPADVLAPGVSVPPAHALNQIVGALAGVVEFDHTGDDLLISNGPCKIALHTLHPEDHPRFTGPKGGCHRFSISAAVLRDALQTVRPAISREETRYYLNGVYVHRKDGALRLVATDGHRLMACTIPVPPGAEKINGSIVPRNTIRILLAAIAGRDDDVSIELDDKVRFSWAGGTLAAKLIDGTFPDVDRVIPTGGAIVATFDSSRLKPAIARLRSALQDKDRAIIFRLEEDSASLEVRQPEYGNASERVDVSLSGRPLEFGLNNLYIEQLLPFDGVVRFTMIDASSPLRVEYPDRPDALFVLMPMRI